MYIQIIIFKPNTSIYLKILNIIIKFFSFLFSGKPYFQGIEDHITDEAGFVDGTTLPLGSPARSSPNSQGSETCERFSRKVFVGGLPPDIDEGKL